MRRADLSSLMFGEESFNSKIAKREGTLQLYMVFSIIYLTNKIWVHIPSEHTAEEKRLEKLELSLRNLQPCAVPPWYT